MNETKTFQLNPDLFSREIKNKWVSLLQQELAKIEGIDIGLHFPALKAAKAHVEKQNGHFLLVDNPDYPTESFSENEALMNAFNWNDRINILQQNPPHLGNGYERELNQEYTRSLFIGPRNRLRKDYMVNDDFKNEFVEVEDGYRVGLRKNYNSNSKKIYLFGSSIAYSFGCEEVETLPSLLEIELGDPNIIVENRGVRAANAMNALFAILDTKIDEGDVVILYGLNSIPKSEREFIRQYVDILDLSSLFKRPHGYGDVFFDTTNHLMPRGNKVVAKAIAKYLEEKLDSGFHDKPITFSDNEKEQFKKYQQSRSNAALLYIDETFPAYIESLKSKFKPGKNGIAAMNCNPFTLGHRHLVAQAASKVDTLYIFVVEEDLSYFKFKERFEMIQEGVKSFKNVELIPTGKFVVSAITFPDYFSKDTIGNTDLNVNLDFDIFMYYIAPTLNLKTRFIGTEPFCKTTGAQHEIMKVTLPKRGIEVTEVERLQNEFGPVSASRVRQLIERKEYDALTSYLPQTTLDFLKKHDYVN